MKHGKSNSEYIVCFIFNRIYNIFNDRKKNTEQNTDLYKVFVDLNKTFNAKCHEVFWKILSKVGLPDKMIKVTVSLFRMMVTVISNKCSGTLSVTTETKQSGILAPVIFFIFLSKLPQHALRYYHEGIKFQFGTSSLLNLKGQNFRSKKIKEEILLDFLFAADFIWTHYQYQEG